MPLSITNEPKQRSAARGTTPLCRSHCSACGQHFRGDKAFFAHRVGPIDDRKCVDCIDDPRFVAYSEAGECRIYPSRGFQTPVTLWTLARDLRQARKAFPDKRARP